jgi:hypothetical protein
LIDIELGGRAARVRLTLFILVGLFGLAATIGYVLPSHAREYESTYHSSFADGGSLPLVFLALVPLFAAVGSRIRFGAGIVLGVFAAAVAIAEALRWILAHLLSVTYSTYGDVIHGLGLAGMALTGLVLPFTELVVFYSARSALERADPKIPSARVVG